MPDVRSAMLAVEYGAFRYLEKPVDTSLLVSTVQRAASMHLLAELRRQVFEETGRGLQLGDLASLEARFEHALEQLWMAFQPIVRVTDGSVFGYEALVRSKEPTLPHPGALLDAAARLKRSGALARRIRAVLAEQMAQVPAEALLFVNVNLADLHDQELVASDGALTPHAERVVLELTERESLHRLAGLVERVSELRGLGFRIAIDDLGAGYAGLSTFSLLEPDIAKIDMSLVRDVHLSERKRRVVQSICELCESDLGVRVICEGVEVEAERDTLAEVGAELLQGYFFARPEAGFWRPREEQKPDGIAPPVDNSKPGDCPAPGEGKEE
jgi:EAL domain-containing protein (putative c-di-GMP-specific phosphodiesterase class I)